MKSIDIAVNTYFYTHSDHFWVYFLDFITDIFSPASLAIICTVGVVYFFYKKNMMYAIAIIIAFLGGISSSILLKFVFMRIRPEHSMIIETGYSFPSNHTTIATIFFTLIIYFILRADNTDIIHKTFHKFIMISHFSALALLVGFSRLYLGVHWFSDILAGIVLGLVWTFIGIAFARYFCKNREHVQNSFTTPRADDL